MIGKRTTVDTRSALLVAFALMASPVAADTDELLIYNWSDYINKDILTAFEQETGIHVTYDVFDSNELLETKLLAGGSGYDLVVPTASFLARQIQAGVFQKLDVKKIPNHGNAWPAITAQTKVYDPGNAYSVNWGWGTTGIGVNYDMVKARLGDVPLDSWDILFNPENAAKLKDCGIMIIDAPNEVFPTVFAYLGLDPKSTNKEDLRAAENVLSSIAPYVRAYDSSVILSAMANGDICLSLDWSPDVYQAQSRAIEAKTGHDIRYVIPKEGAFMWFDQLAIPKDAAHVDNAHKFINFVMQPEIIAQVSNYTFVANGIEASIPLLDDEVRTDPGIYPPKETVERLFAIDSYPPKFQRKITRSWTRVKSGQ